jgi:hypothetical protein
LANRRDHEAATDPAKGVSPPTPEILKAVHQNVVQTRVNYHRQPVTTTRLPDEKLLRQPMTSLVESKRLTLEVVAVLIAGQDCLAQVISYLQLPFFISQFQFVIAK